VVTKFVQLRTLHVRPTGALELRAMTLRVWEWIAVVTLACLAVLFFATGGIAAGVTLLSLAILGAAWRGRVVEREVAGGYTRPRAVIGLVVTATLFGALVTVVVFVVIAALRHWSHDPQGRVAIYALTGLEILLFVEMRRRGDEAANWLVGSRAEREVGRQLEPLRAEGWHVVHNLKKDRGGNVDHLVWSERGAYAIETKSGSFRRAHLGQAKGSAWWAKEKFGAQWVEPLICVGDNPSPEPRYESGVWVLSAEHLRAWLRARPVTARGIPLSR
jgi:hypothetical protein